MVQMRKNSAECGRVGRYVNAGIERQKIREPAGLPKFEIWGHGILKLLLRNTEVSNEFIFLISKPKNQGADRDRTYGRVWGARQQIWGPRDPGDRCQRTSYCVDGTCILCAGSGTSSLVSGGALMATTVCSSKLLMLRMSW